MTEILDRIFKEITGDERPYGPDVNGRYYSIGALGDGTEIVVANSFGYALRISHKEIKIEWLLHTVMGKTGMVDQVFHLSDPDSIGKAKELWKTHADFSSSYNKLEAS